MFRAAQKEKVYVGLSGGVDSSVAARRLIDAGHDVTGVFIKTWHPDFMVCNWEAERLDAMRVAVHLGIPFHTFDATDTYRDAVAMYMIEEYKKGRTPNPDVMCNQHVKFGVFLAHARAEGATKVATGHYARVCERDGTSQLLRGKDAGKDQSYFLWTLTQEQLAHTLFPVGDSEKLAIRKEAARAGLPTARKSDSQGVCFLGEIDMKEFLSHYVSVTPGEVHATDGSVVGTHDGALFYTLGQRHGFTVATKGTQTTPWYVVGKDMERNVIVVDHEVKKSNGATLHLSQCNFIEHMPAECEAQCRYRQKPLAVRFERVDTADATVRIIADSVEMPSSGQSCVLYDGDICLGGGIIERIS